MRNASATSARSVSSEKPLTPSAQCAARASDLACVAVLRMGGPPGWSGRRADDATAGRLAAGPQVAHLGHRPVEPPEATLHRHADGGEVLLPHADAHGHLEAPAGQHVHRGQLRGDERRGVPRQDHRVDEDPHPLGERRGGRAQREAVEVVVGDPLAGRDRGERRPRRWPGTSPRIRDPGPARPSSAAARPRRPCADLTRLFDRRSQPPDVQLGQVHGTPRDQLAWRSLLSSTVWAARARTSTTPVVLLRRNSRLGWPLSSRAFTTRPSGSVTRVPAVT